MWISQASLFAQAAELRSLSRAASPLYVAQPALSKGIQALEADLGVKLFDRSNRGVTMTAAGLRLHEHCPTIFQSEA